MSNRSGIGARIRATATVSGSPLTQTREVSGSTGYCGANLVQHFGLGDAATADLEIRWPSGIVQHVDGVAADQFLVVVETSAIGVEATPSPERFGSAAHPNPFRDTTRIRFAPPGRGAATLEIFDASGRRVRTLAAPPGGIAVTGEDAVAPAASFAHVEWDGRDAAGTPVPAGVYFYRAGGAGAGPRGKISRLR